MIGFARDVWAYISIGYFTQKTVAGEVGSSVMPHKVNPIDFENCEGNLGLAIAMFQHLAAKLPISRWQRDLSDSTAIRGIGTAFGHVVVALSSLERGLGKLQINTARIAEEVEGEKAWEVVAEAIQTMMRRHALEEFVARLPLDDGAKAALLALEPKTYVGLASELVERFTPRGTPGIKR